MARKSIDEIYRPMPGDEPQRPAPRATPSPCAFAACNRSWVCLLMAPLAIAFAGMVTLCTPLGLPGANDPRVAEAAVSVRQYERVHGYFPAALDEADADIQYSTDCRPVDVVCAGEVRVVAKVCPDHKRHVARIGLSGRRAALVMVRSSAR